MPSAVSTMISRPHSAIGRVGQHHAPAREHGGEHAERAVEQQRNRDHAGEHRRSEHAADSTQPRTASRFRRARRHDSAGLLTTAANQVTSEAEVTPSRCRRAARQRHQAPRRGTAWPPGADGRAHHRRRGRFVAFERAADGIQAGGQHRRHQQEAAESAGEQPEVPVREDEQRGPKRASVSPCDRPGGGARRVARAEHNQRSAAPG
jgi:hypothetical protein